MEPFKQTSVLLTGPTGTQPSPARRSVELLQRVVPTPHEYYNTTSPSNKQPFIYLHTWSLA